MLSSEQKKWLSKLSDIKTISVIPYNPKNRLVFNKIKKDLIDNIGDIRVSLRGSTFLGISGQGEVDLYIPVAKKDFNIYLKKLINYLGDPGSIYDLRRVRFVKYIDNIKIEIFLINKNSRDWINGCKFENFLKHSTKYLDEYERIKKKYDGFSVRQYYTAKIKFINKILNKI